jgi:hypothetical protein
MVEAQQRRDDLLGRVTVQLAPRDLGHHGVILLEARPRRSGPRVVRVRTQRPTGMGYVTVGSPVRQRRRRAAGRLDV